VIDYEDALALLLADVVPLDVERVAPADAAGRVLAHPVVSRESLPPFDNSAMDGFALRTHGAVQPAGSMFDIVGERAAGDGPVVADAGAWEIMTGAPVPEGADTIVPVEQVEIVRADPAGRPLEIRLRVDVPPSQHVRRGGSDIAAGDVAIPGGCVLREAEIMVMAALGVGCAVVRRRPRVAVITTGRELVDGAAPLEPGRIRNSNGPFLEARLRAAGAVVVHRESVSDDAAAFEEALARVAACGVDVVVTTGAVSMGRYDFIPSTLQALGATTLFHKVRIRPGKPVLAAHLPDGPRVLALPGNPASTAVGLRFFVEPLLRALLGLPPESGIRLPLASAYRKKFPLRMHLKARVSVDADGRVRVHVLDGQESFRIRPLLSANAWAVVPADVDSVDAGASVLVTGRGHFEPLALED
jgi:molybdopterin molybdotransferase